MTMSKLCIQHLKSDDKVDVKLKHIELPPTTLVIVGWWALTGYFGPSLLNMRLPIASVERKIRHLSYRSDDLLFQGPSNQFPSVFCIPIHPYFHHGLVRIIKATK